MMLTPETARKAMRSVPYCTTFLGLIEDLATQGRGRAAFDLLLEVGTPPALAYIATDAAVDLQANGWCRATWIVHCLEGVGACWRGVTWRVMVRRALEAKSEKPTLRLAAL